MNLLLVDDHAMFTDGLKFLLRVLDKQLIIDDAGDVAQATALAATRSYDLVLVDLKMPGTKGLEALRVIRKAYSDTPVVVVSGEDDPQVVRAAIDEGAMGYIPKSSTGEVLIHALRLILAKGIYLPPIALSAEPDRKFHPGFGADELILKRISPRQMEVLRCVIPGKSNKIIARELHISEGTVKQHIHSVMQALGARNRTEAVYAAAKLGLRLV